MVDDKKVFSRGSILAKQEEQREEYKKKINEMRKVFEDVASTSSGEKVLQYLFILCGGDLGSVRRDKEGVIDIEDTILTLGARGVWENVRFNLESETIKRIERHNWEQ